ncbi:bacteriophage abortive infection AbiH family protein [Lactococcus formosensis]|nr:AbiH family protein [Lactococcus formosensis]MDG6143226.1 bacteriophage abortive infection AbiH family protein [Lactococcus formosensis]
MKSVSEIYILGHSLGDIDLPYFREIIKKINNEIEWKIYAYSLSEEKYYSEKMRKLGITNFRFLIWDDL